MNRRNFLTHAAAAAAAVSVPKLAFAAARTDSALYRETILKTAGMAGDPVVRKLAAKYGLNVLNVTWEDTGRFKNSSVGPNISDMSIQVQHKDAATGRYRLSLMPVIRYPNFSDKTADLTPEDFNLVVGNEKGQRLRQINLEQYLRDPRAYLHDAKSWKGTRDSMWANKRDANVLVSAQACFLPVPQKGEATFNPVLFNYQSMEGDPAVLSILCTREGTSATIIDNKRDGFEAGFSWGQRLYFNQNGERSSFTGGRMSDYLLDGEQIFSSTTKPSASPTAGAAGENGLNMVLLIQVPLKQKNPMRFGAFDGVLEMSAPATKSMRERSDVEEAVIGHGDVEGPYTEIDNIDIERDPDFPVRVTVQFYQATSNGVVSNADMARIAHQIERVYDDAKYVGSLVTQGDTGRPTEYSDHGAGKQQPRDWWQKFWNRFWNNLGQGPIG